MKITIDSMYTNGSEKPRVKEDIATFKACKYTEKDLLSAIISQAEQKFPEAGLCAGDEVIKCDIKAFPAGTYFGNRTHFFVEMVTEGWREMAKIQCYLDPETLEIDLRTLPNDPYEPIEMFHFTRYKAS